MFRFLLFTLGPLLAVFVLASFMLTEEGERTAIYYTAVHSPSFVSTTEARTETASNNSLWTAKARDRGMRHLDRYSAFFSCILSSCRLSRPPGVVVLSRQCVAPRAHQHSAITSLSALGGALIHAALCIYLVPRLVFALQTIHINRNQTCSGCTYASLSRVKQVRQLAPRMASMLSNSVKQPP